MVLQENLSNAIINQKLTIMYLLRNNKIEIISLKEDKSDEIQGIHAIKTLADLEEENKKLYGDKPLPTYYVKDKKAKLIYYTPKHGGQSGWMFETTQSEFNDDSGLGHGNGIWESKGAAIAQQLKSGYKVFNGGIEITKEITQH